MGKKDFKILFLDDEIYAEDENPAIIAQEELEAAGYDVEVTDKMSDVIDAYYKQYHHLYLLDIDMGKVEDVFEGNGATVGEILRRLSSISNVVVYSARGQVKDWLKAANYHFYHYVHKKWGGEEELLSIVDDVFESVQTMPIQVPVLNKPEYSDSVVMYYEDCQIDLKYFQDKFDTLIVADSLSSLTEMAKEKNPKLVLIVLPNVPENLSKRKTFEDQLPKVMEVQPMPNVIICIETSKQGKQLLKIVNSHPFRIVDIESVNFEIEFQEAAEKAIFWYGEEEIYELPDETQIIRKPMSEQEVADLRKDTWEYDEFEEYEMEEYEEGEEGEEGEDTEEKND